MSLRYEQYNALKKTRAFLSNILCVGTDIKSLKAMRNAASDCLKHFPPLYENGQPVFSQDEFTEDMHR